MVTNSLAAILPMSLEAEYGLGTMIGGMILSGLTTVFAALLILILIVYALGKAMPFISQKNQKNAEDKAEQGAAKAAAASFQPAVQEADGAEDETVAVIAAAVATAMADSGAPYAITSITRAKDARPVWGFAGMTQNTRPF